MPPGGKPVEPGIIARAGRAIAAQLTSWFGPDKPQQVSSPSGTKPRAFDYPTGYNIQIQPRNLEPVSFQQMRMLADSFDLIRICIETRKDQMAKLHWQFAARRLSDEKQSDYKKRNAGDKRLGKLTEFFQSPDKEHTWQEWIRLLLEEMLVIDAPSIAPVVDNQGTLWSQGKELFALEVIDGSTITRKIDINGRTPWPPEVAYQQIIKGLPSVDFTREQLIYKPRNQRAHKFFGYSPVEQIIMTINIGLRREMHLLGYYTEGNVPEAIAQVPKEWSADQVVEFQNWFDSVLSGTENLTRRHKITFVPECGTVNFTKDPKLKDELDEWLMRVICYAFSLSPQPFIRMMNRSTAETSVEQAAAEGLTPIMIWVEDLINFAVLPRYFGINDIDFSFLAEKDNNPKEESEIVDKYLRSGVMTLDQAAERIGLEPLADGAGKRNMIYTATGAVPVDVVIDRADNPPEPVIPGGPGQQQTDGEPAPEPGKKNPPKKKFRGYN